MKIAVLDGYTENPGDLNWGDLERLGEVTMYSRTPPELVMERVGDAEAIPVNRVVATEEALQQCGNVRHIGVLVTGCNVIDTAAASARGIVVYNIPSYRTDVVGQYTIALSLEICHHIGYHAEAVKQGAWSTSEDWCFWDYLLIELAGKAMGIVGYRRTGKTTGRIARALGMEVLAYEGEEEVGQGGEFVSLKMFLTQSDIISLYCPLFPSTEGIIDRETIGKMKDGVIPLNDSRGPLIVERDLVGAPNYGEVYAAGLDVVSMEPIRLGNLLLGAKNCLITPHTAWASKESRQCLMNIAVENLRNFQMEKPVNVVNG